MVKTIRTEITIKLVPTMAQKTVIISNLTQDEIDWDWLLQYINDYYCPEWYEATRIIKKKPI